MDKSEVIKTLVLGLSKLPQCPKYPETGIIPPSDKSETSLDITCGAETLGSFLYTLAHDWGYLLGNSFLKIALMTQIT